MALYTVTLNDVTGPDVVSLTDGSTYATLEVSAGRGPKGDGFTGGSYSSSTGQITFTSNDGIGFSTGDIRPEITAAVAAAEAAQAGAETAEAGAEAAQAATESIFDQFGDQYLGPKASDPTVDNDGDPLTEGDIYFNTTDSVLKFYSGSAWVAPESIATTAASDAQAAQAASEAAQAAAETAETNAETAETNAGASASSASSSASAASTSASEAAASAASINLSSIDIDGGTIDGTVIGGATPAAITGTAITGTSLAVDGTSAIELVSDKTVTTPHTDYNLLLDNGSDTEFVIRLDSVNSGSIGSSHIKQISEGTNRGALVFATENGSGGTVPDRLKIDYNGDISFYDSAGSSQSFFWDASAERLGLGTTSPIGLAHLSQAGGADTMLVFENTSGTNPFQVGQGNDDSLRFYYNASEKMRITSSGNVGIGTSSPTAVAANYTTLHLDGSSGSGIHLTKTTSGTTATDGSHLFNAGGDFYLYHYEGGDIIFSNGASATERMRLDSSGNVGIGTSSPSYNLDIQSSGAAQARIQSASGSNAVFRIETAGTTDETKIYFGSSFDNDRGQIIYAHANNSMQFRTDAAERMRIDSSGNVGIGTGSPQLDFVVSNNGAQGFEINSSGLISGGIDVLAYNRSTSAYAPIYNNASYHVWATSTSERMRITSSGNVGIGTTSPDHTLRVNGDARVGNLHFKTSDFGAGGTGKSIYADAAGLGVLGFISTTAFDFSNGFSSRLRIDSSGNVGIGTSSPSAPLDIAGTSGTESFRIGSTVGGTDFGITVTENDGVLLNAAEGATGRHMKFATGGTERMRIDSSGNLLVGKTAQSTSTNGIQLQSDYTISAVSTAVGYFYNKSDGGSGSAFLFRSNDLNVGSISVTASSTAYNTSSDHRLKENVVELTNATDRIKQLEPKRFNFIADADTTVDGFLAHEVQAVVPEAIHGTHNEVDADGNPVYQGIDQSKLVPLLVATIKELEARITALENA